MWSCRTPCTGKGASTALSQPQGRLETSWADNRVLAVLVPLARSAASCAFCWNQETAEASNTKNSALGEEGTCSPSCDLPLP